MGIREVIYKDKRRIIYNSDFERFNKKYDVAENGCWVWNGAKNKAEYGNFRLFQIMIGAHVASYLMFNNTFIQKDKNLICHSCDNPKCVNPAHLWAGSASDNIQDALNKNRAYKGVLNGRSVLTEKDIVEIRLKYKTGKHTHKEIAKMYGVAKPTISSILRNESWRHIT